MTWLELYVAFGVIFLICSYTAAIRHVKKVMQYYDDLFDKINNNRP